MELLVILFTFFSIFVSIAVYSNGFPRKALTQINNKYLVFCQSSLNATDDQLIKTLKPVVLGFSMFSMILAAMLLQWWGEDDKDVKQLSLTSFGMIALSGLVLITKKEFSSRINQITNMLASTAKWSSLALALVIAFIVVAFKAAGQTVVPEELEKVIVLHSTSLAYALILLAVILFTAIIALPFIFQKLVILIVRGIVDFTLKKERTNPVAVPVLFTTTGIALITFASYILEKIA